MKIFTYRYMWTLLDSDSSDKKVNFKIITDTEEGLQIFEKNVVESISNLENFGREYISEIDVSKLGLFEKISLIGG